MTRHLPTGWAQRRASQLCSLITSGSRGWAKYYADTGAGFIRVQNIRRGRIDLDLDDLQHVRPPSNAEGSRTRLQAHDITITITADLGRVGLVSDTVGEAYVNQHVALARPTNSVEPAYLAWFITGPDAQKQLGLLDRGATRSGLGLKDIEGLVVPLPPLAEQRRIVAQIEALFARTRRARTDLERIASLSFRYEQALRDEVLQAGQDAGWPEQTLGEVISEVRNGIAAKPSDEPPGMRILRISAVRQGRVMLADHRYHRAATDAEARPYLLRNGDLLFIRFNGNPHLVAACGMVRDLDGECVCPDKLIRMRLNPRFAAPEYIEMAVGSGLAREQLVNHIKTAAGQHGISGADLKTLRLPMPDVTTQTTVAAEVLKKRNTGLVARQEATRALALLDRLEQSILARTFRGELVPQEAGHSSVERAAENAPSPESLWLRRRAG